MCIEEYGDLEGLKKYDEFKNYPVTMNSSNISKEEVPEAFDDL